MTTLANLVKKRRSSGGSITGSLAYGAKERLKEKFDPRQIFDQKGLLSALFPSLRAYKSPRASVGKKLTDKLITPETSSPNPILESIQANTKISAKNSMVLPAMHRDMNVMRQNIIKLVKLKGGEATNKADMWFMNAKTQEAAYENNLDKKTTPVKIDKTEKAKESEDVTGTITKIISDGKDMLMGFVNGWTSKLEAIGVELVAAGAAAVLTISTALAAALVAIAGAYAVNKILPKDVTSVDPIEVMHKADKTGKLTTEAENAFVLDTPLKDKPKAEQMLVNRKKQTIEEYIQYNQDNFKGPVLSEKQAKDLNDYWGIKVDPKLILKAGEAVTKHTVADLKKPETQSTQSEAQTKTPDPKALMKYLFDKTPEKMSADVDTIKQSNVSRVTEDVQSNINQYGESDSGITSVPGTAALVPVEQRIIETSAIKKPDVGAATKNLDEIKDEITQKPQINIMKTKENKVAPSARAFTQNIEIASVYDEEMLKMLGMA